MTQRECGSCTLCCKLVPVKEVKRKPNGCCVHQKVGKGCTIYAQRPASCMFWSCGWLVNDDTADLSRPDRAHYVIDILPDFITVVPHDGSPSQNIEVVQVWVDPKFPDAHRDPKLRAFLERRGEQGKVAIIRYNSQDGFVLAPPSVTGDGWVEQRSQLEVTRRDYSLGETMKALGGTLSVQVSP